jgi:hypothetical protein
MNYKVALGWLDSHAGAIQALCSVVGAGGLIWYCCLTLGIHRASVRQANASMRPFIVVDEMSERDVPDFKQSLLPVSKDNIFIIRNLGNGPAMDIQWAKGSSGHLDVRSGCWTKLGDLAAGDWSHIPNGPVSIMCDRLEDGMTVLFSDISENRYETVEEYRDGSFYQRCREIKSGRNNTA